MNMSRADDQPGSLIAADLAAIVASLARQTRSAIDPLADFPQPASFAACTWSGLGLDQSGIARIAGQANAMCGTSQPDPDPDQPCGRFCADLWQQWQTGPREITFFTSGSTGQPKPCLHTEDMLVQEVRAVTKMLAGRVGYLRKVLVTVPLHHMYGFMFGWLMPRFLGQALATDSVPDDPGPRLEMLLPLPTVVATRLEEASEGLLLVGIPHLWQRLSGLGPGLPAPGPKCAGGRHLLLSASAPLADDTLATLTRSGLDCLEIYGASESGAIAWRELAGQAFCLLPHWRRGKDESGLDCLCRDLPDGDQQVLANLDRLEWADDRHCRPGGRMDNAIQIGGYNVFPSRVAASLKKLAGVADCMVRPMRRDEGWRLKAFVVPASPDLDTRALRQSLQDHARNCLDEVERPGSYSFGPALPRNDMGKDTDW